MINWSQNFGAPIVHAWRITNGKLVKVDLFSSSAIPDRLPSPEDLMQGKKIFCHLVICIAIHFSQVMAG